MGGFWSIFVEFITSQGRRAPAAHAARRARRGENCASAAPSPQMCAIDASRAELSIDACIDGVCMGAFPSNLGLRVTALLFGRGIRDSLIG